MKKGLDDRMRRLLRRTTTDDELCDLIVRLDEPLRTEAAERLLKQRPRTGHLVFLVDHVPNVRERAWQQLLTHGPPNADLRTLLERGITLIGATIHAAAGERLLAQDPTNDDLVHVVRYGSGQQEEAWRRLCVRSPTIPHLSAILICVEFLRMEAARLLIDANPSNDDLRKVLRYVPGLQAQAANHMMLQSPTASDLLCIMEYVADHRTAALDRLLTLRPSCDELKKALYLHPTHPAAWQYFVDAPASNGDLHDVVRYCPALCGKAARLLLTRKPSDEHLQTIANYVADLRPTVEHLLERSRRLVKGRRRK